MKKLLMSLCALLAVILTALPALAQNVNPLQPQAQKSLVAGKTFTARVDGYAMSYDNPGEVWLSFVLCEKCRFDASLVEGLKQGDVISLPTGMTWQVQSVAQDETGIVINEGEELYGTLYFTKGEDGSYTAITDDEHTLWQDAASIQLKVTDSLIYRDFSGSGEPDAEPVIRTLSDLMADLENEVSFNEDNTILIFDENGALTALERYYSPWN